MRVFVAGGSGVIGQSLVPMLVARGHHVTATTTGVTRLDVLTRLGAEGVVMDGLDAAAVGEAVAAAEPDAIVNEMTALSPTHAGKLNPRRPDRFFTTTNLLRSSGTDHLVAAARASGNCRVVAQSAAIVNAIGTGDWITTEQDPLIGPAQSMGAINHLEEVVTAAGGAVLRYGGLYGAGANADQIRMIRRRMFPLVGRGTGYMSWLHVGDAATATVAALEQQATGVFNIVDDDPAPVRAWLPYLAECVGAKPPRRIPVWLARLVAGDTTVSMMVDGRGFSNAKAKHDLGWQPHYSSWREGFREEFR